MGVRAEGPEVDLIRIATWNVERPKPQGWKIPPAQLRRMAEVSADIWVLTETQLDHAPSEEHRFSVFSPPLPDGPAHERWTAIWSRWPLTPIEDPPPHERGSVAAIAETPSGPLLVYGTVIAWANDPLHDDGSPARTWEVHRGEIDRQAAEWAIGTAARFLVKPQLRDRAFGRVRPSTCGG